MTKLERLEMLENMYAQLRGLLTAFKYGSDESFEVMSAVGSIERLIEMLKIEMNK